MSIWRWADYLDPVAENARVTLGEGGTPLVRSRALGPRAGLGKLYFKLEFANPTGSYKDRFAAVAVSDMVARGVRRCLATSSGNTGAALAAYCAAAGIRCDIAIVETAPLEKMRQMLAYGAVLYRVRRFGLDQGVSSAVFDILQARCQRDDAMLQISAFRFSPTGMRGVQTLGYELAERLAGGIEHVFCPAGGGGLALAVARGFADLDGGGRNATGPHIEIVQPTGNDTMATPLRTGASRARDVQCTSHISGLQVPNVIDGTTAIEACRASGGSGHVVTDEEVWEVQRRLAREEGIFCEPAGAVSVAGALRAHGEGHLRSDAGVVCLITGSGFKDAPSVERMTSSQAARLVELEEFAQCLE